VNYIKPPLTLEQQAELILSRGMTGDKSLIIERLSAVNYYRLSGYWFHFRQPDHRFKPGTTFENVWRRYVFDRHLRLQIMDAVERIEISVRTQLAYHHAHRHGTFAYATNPASFPKLDSVGYTKLIDRITEETKRSREVFVNHFHKNYGDAHSYLPIWMVTEVMTFGTVLSFYRGSSHKVKQGIASIFRLPDTVFESWLLSLNAIRNICAHHGRLWDQVLGYKPLIPLKGDYPDWHQPVEVANNRIFGVLTICKYCLDRIAPQSRWPKRLQELLAEYPDIPQINMGFPDDWQSCTIWKT